MAKLDLGLPSYMGRGILLGLTSQGEPAAVYFVEGRSPPSRKRKLVAYEGEGIIRVDVNSQTSVKEMIAEGGNPDLLLYDAMIGDREGRLVVSNGFQTNHDPVWEGEGREAENLKEIVPGGIYKGVKGLDRKYDHEAVRNVLRDSLLLSGSEVDDLRTARIAGFIDVGKSECGHVGIVTRPRDPQGELTDRDSVAVSSESLRKGSFIMVATYGVWEPGYHNGLPPNLSSVENYTRRVNLDGTSPEELTEEVWGGLPKEILVGVGSAMPDSDKPAGFGFSVRNMEE